MFQCQVCSVCNDLPVQHTQRFPPSEDRNRLMRCQISDPCHLSIHHDSSLSLSSNRRKCHFSTLTQQCHFSTLHVDTLSCNGFHSFLYHEIVVFDAALRHQQHYVVFLTGRFLFFLITTIESFFHTLMRIRRCDSFAFEEPSFLNPAALIHPNLRSSPFNSGFHVDGGGAKTYISQSCVASLPWKHACMYAEKTRFFMHPPRHIACSRMEHLILRSSQEMSPHYLPICSIGPKFLCTQQVECLEKYNS